VGHVEGSTTVYGRDEIRQTTLDGDVEVTPIESDDQRPAPFEVSSAAVVRRDYFDFGWTTGGT
jgi:hypothetical protein